MDRPPDRCEFVYDEADYFKPYCCWRDTWHERHCVWHAPVSGKPSEHLERGRVNLSWGYPEDVRDEWIGARGERLDGAALREADLRHVSLSDCTLIGADLSGANLLGGDLSNADLREATLADADARRCRAENTVFEKADLSGADLSGANLSGAALRGADLSGANLREADLSGADLRKTDLTGAHLQGADLPGTRLYGADLSAAEGIDTDFTGAILREATLSGAYLMGADLEAATLSGADVSGADLRGATLADAVLQAASFRGSDLREADLSDVDATDADFGGATLERARLDHADLYGTSLVGAGLYAATFANAATNERTDFGEFVVYDPRYGDDGAGSTGDAGAPTSDGSGDAAGEGEGDSGAGRDAGDADAGDGQRGPDAPTGRGDHLDGTDDEVDDLTKAVGSYRLLGSLARENEFPDLWRRYYLRRKDVLRHRYRTEGRRIRWVRSAATNLVTRYGEAPWRVVATAGAVVVGCGLLYPLGWIRPEGGTYVWYTTDPAGAASAFAEGLYFSARTFATAPSAYRAAGPGRVLAAVESILGLALVALLVAVLARRGSR